MHSAIALHTATGHGNPIRITDNSLDYLIELLILSEHTDISRQTEPIGR